MKINCILSNENIRVIDFTSEHITKDYISWLNDKEVVKYSEQRHVSHNFDTVTKYFYEKQNSNDYFLAIEIFNKEWTHIGNIGVSVDKSNNIADISILIGNKNFWGKGIALIAWKLVLDYLLENIKFRLVTAGTMEINEPMLKIINRSEMKIDATLPARFNFNGNYISMVLASKDLH